MKALTLWQPWASLWLSNAKVHETRPWPTEIRGTIAVHAGRRFVRDVPPELVDILEDEFGGHWGMDLPIGAIIGTLALVDCHQTVVSGNCLAANNDDKACGDFAPGRYAFRRGAFRLFKTPIPWKGRQRWFEVPDDVIAGAS